jgi:hypothetical protein
MAAKIMIRAAIAIMLLLAVGEEASALLIQKTIEVRGRSPPGKNKVTKTSFS